jgi:hypothetical protein
MTDPDDLRARGDLLQSKAAELRARAPSMIALVRADFLHLADQYDELADQLGRLASSYERARRLTQP